MTSSAALPSAATAEAVGSKAASLAWLRAQGFDVPDWDVVPPALFDRFRSHHSIAWPDPRDSAAVARTRETLASASWPPGMEEEVRAVAAPLLEGGPLAARSSATLEDLDDASFAGQYDSVLHLDDVEATLGAVRRCWASALTERAAAYLANRGLDYGDLRMAVILQRMVPARAAGVAFGIDPVTGADDEVVIEACQGTGDALVSGHATPDRHRVAWGEGRIRESSIAETEPALGDEEVLALAWQVARVQAAYGRPVDLEWAHDGTGFRLLQVRPVTAHGSSAFPGEWTTADMKDGGVSAGVCTPFMASLYERVFVSATPRHFDSVGLAAPRPETQPWYMVAYGRPYWNVGHVKARLARLPGFRERSFDEDLGIAISYEGDGVATALTPRTLWRGLRVLRGMGRSFRRRMAENERASVRIAERLDRREARDPADLDDAALRADLVRLLAEEYVHAETAYFVTIYDNSNAQTLFQERLAAVAGAEDAAQRGLELLGGLRDLSHLRPTREEEALARRLAGDPECRAALLDRAPEDVAADLRAGQAFPGASELRAHLDRWGWLAPRTLEILQPRWQEDPTPLVQSLRRRVAAHVEGRGGGSAPPRLEEQEQRQRRAYEEALAVIETRLRARPGLFGARRRAFRRILRTARRLLWWREEMRMLSTRKYSEVRRSTLEYGARLARDGALAQAEDVFFLTLDEILELAREHGRVVTADLRGRVERRRMAYDGFRDHPNPDEIGDRHGEGARALAAEPAPDDDGALVGIGGSAGVYEGRARVIHDVEEVDRLEPGDVLVTRFTDPGWTSAFSGLGAVVTETGGVLSHAAVIAREYGFPAVLAVSGATRRLADGERIVVDGGRGTVRRVAPRA